MNTNHTLNRLLYLLCFIILLAAGLYFFIPRFWFLPKPQVEPKSGDIISVLQTIEIRFPQEMDKFSVESRVTIIPVVETRKRWNGNTLEILPVTSFPMETELSILLSAGAKSLDGKSYGGDQKWTFTTRAAQIAYLGTATTSPEIWLVDEDGKNSRQITHTGGNVTGFSPIPDGSGFFYSSKNTLGGSDIHSIDRDGKQDAITLECGKDTCFDPVVSKDSRLLAFSRTGMPENGSGSSKPQIYTAIIKETELEPTPLIEENYSGGVLPSFSPDGLKISYYDADSKGLRVINKAGGNDFLLGTNQPQTAAWSSDGSELVFIDDELGEDATISKLYLLDLVNSSINEPLKEILKNVNLGEPDLSPDGLRLAVGVKAMNGPDARQMWVINLADGDIKKITDDLTLMNAAPIWRPDEGALAFQQAQLGSSGAKPVVLVWDAKSGELVQAATDAAMPAWLP